MISATGSAKRTPKSPFSVKFGSININGTKRTTFLKSAKNKEIFALPKAKKVCWYVYI